MAEEDGRTLERDRESGAELEGETSWIKATAEKEHQYRDDNGVKAAEDGGFTRENCRNLTEGRRKLLLLSRFPSSS